MAWWSTAPTTQLTAPTISGSNDYSNWTQITDAVSGGSTDYADWKGVALSEIEIYGTVSTAGNS